MHFFYFIALDALPIDIRALDVDINDPPASFAEQVMMWSSSQFVPHFGSRNGYRRDESGFEERAECVVHCSQREGRGFLGQCFIYPLGSEMFLSLTAEMIEDQNPLISGFQSLSSKHFPQVYAI